MSDEAQIRKEFSESMAKWLNLEGYVSLAQTERLVDVFELMLENYTRKLNERLNPCT